MDSNASDRVAISEGRHALFVLVVEDLGRAVAFRVRRVVRVGPFQGSFSVRVCRRLAFVHEQTKQAKVANWYGVCRFRAGERHVMDRFANIASDRTVTHLSLARVGGAFLAVGVECRYSRRG